MTTIRVEQSGSFWRKFTPLFGAGLVGIAAAAPLIAGQIRGLIDDKLASAPPLPVIVGAAQAQTKAIMGVAIAAALHSHRGSACDPTWWRRVPRAHRCSRHCAPKSPPRWLAEWQRLQ